MIELKNITKRYGKNDNEVLALNDVSLHIDKGEFVGGIISLCERVAASGNTSILLSA